MTYDALLQVELIRNPEAGSVIRGSGGVRKIRWAMRGSGKRGGLRILYYWHRTRGILLLLVAYAKSGRDDLTRVQLRMLKQAVKEEFR